MKKTITPKKLCLVFVLAAIANLSNAQWVGSSAINNPICTVATSQTNVQSATDGKGGAIMVWGDNRSTKTNIYAQRIDSNGNVKWTIGGVRVFASTLSQSSPRIAADDKGGAYIVWVQTIGSTETDIYGGHLDSNGAELWVGGRGICIATGNQTEVEIAATGTGNTNGVVVVWTDGRNFATAGDDIYIHRLTYNGNLNVVPNGKLVTVSNQTQSQVSPQIISLGGSATWIAFKNYMGNAISGFDIYTSYFDMNVNQSYSIDVSQQQGNEDHQKLASDGASGIVIVWDLATSTASGQNIYAQRVGIGGTTLWTAGGIAVCNVIGVQGNPEITADGFGNTIMVWEDGRNVQYPILYTQRFNSAGVAKWTANGKAVGSTAVNSQKSVSLVANGTGGAVYAFTDARNASVNGGYYDLYAQQFDSLGTAVNPDWNTTGTEVSVATNTQDFAKIVASGNGSYIITWEDGRNGASDIYASKIEANGLLPLRLVSFDAQAKDKNIVLKWMTENEINTSYFEIEYSRNTTDFMYVGKVNAAGKETNNYTFTYLPKDNGSAYFRLKMLDKDGKYVYSNIIKIDINIKNVFEIKMYPNFVENFVTLNINSKTNEIFNLAIYSALGNTIETFSMPVLEGNNTKNIDVSKLSKGCYMLSVYQKNGSIKTIKFIKQ